MSGRYHKPNLTPGLKGLIDNVLVPALVRQYLAEMPLKKELAQGLEPVAAFAAKSTARAEEGR